MSIELCFRAACAGELAVLQSFPDLIREPYEGATLLHHAAIHNQREAAEWLIAQGAYLEAIDDEFRATPVQWAHEKGHTEMVEWLLSQGARLGPLAAAGFGKVDVYAALYAAGPSILQLEQPWGTAVHNACFWGRVEMLEWLIAAGADIGKRSQHGYTPLEICENQARNGRSHASIVTDARKAEIEHAAALMAARLLKAQSSATEPRP